MDQKKTILLITTTHLAKNPRLVKEIDALHQHYRLIVVFFALLPQYQIFDQEIIARYPNVDFRRLNWLKKYYPCRFFYTSLQKLLMLLWKLSGKMVWVEQLFFPGFSYLKRKCRGIDADVIHGHNPGSWGVAVQLAKQKKIPSSFDIEDFHSGEYETEDPKKSLLEAIEDKYYLQTNHLTAASPLIAEAYHRKYPEKKASVINNVFPKEQFRHRGTFNQKMPLKLVWFSQMIGPDRGLKEIVEALNLLGFKVSLSLYGEYEESYRTEITQQLRESHEINFLGLLGNNELNKALSAYDVGIASEMGHTPNRDFCLTNKIFAYVQAGLSVLASDTAAQTAFLQQYPSVGHLYHRKSPGEIADILIRLHHHRDILHQQQNAAYELGQSELCWEKESLHLLHYFERLFADEKNNSALNIAITVDPEIPVPPTLYGGIERIVYLLVEELCKRGHQVTLFAHPKSETSAKLVPWRGKRSPSLFDTIQNSHKLWSHYQEDRYDVVHSFSRLAYLSPLLNRNVAKVMSYQREPTLSQVKKAQLLAKVESLSFTGCSNYIANQLKGVAVVSTIYNGIELEKYQFRQSVAEDAPLVFLGRLEKIKGAHLAIELAKQSNRKLIIAGNISKAGQKYFDEEILPQLNENIEYVGAINDEQKNEILGNACALLMPILWDEPFGIVMIEAMACGTPVVGFPKGAVKEVVLHGHNGYLAKDMEGLVDGIQKIHEIDRAVVRNHVAKHFSSEIIVDQYLSVYNNTIAACRGKRKE